MARLRVLCFVTTIILVVAVVAAAQGYVVILKSGHKIRCKEPMRIEGPNAILTLATGTLASYPLQLVDVVETERYNQLGLGDALRGGCTDVAGADAGHRLVEPGVASHPPSEQHLFRFRGSMR